LGAPDPYVPIERREAYSNMSNANLTDLKPYATPNCYGCKSTGRVVGFGADGLQCPCIHHCYTCDELVPYVLVEADDPMPKQFCCNTCHREYQEERLIRKSNV